MSYTDELHILMSTVTNISLYFVIDICRLWWYVSHHSMLTEDNFKIIDFRFCWFLPNDNIYNIKCKDDDVLVKLQVSHVRSSCFDQNRIVIFLYDNNITGFKKAFVFGLSIYIERWNFRLHISRTLLQRI